MARPHPMLLTSIDGHPRLRTAAPPSPSSDRSWRLAVVAVQLTVERGRVSARVRAHHTGAAAPEVIELGDSAVVEVALASGEAPLPASRALAPPALDGSAARLQLFLDGALLDEVALPHARLVEEPGPRAFGHVYCRWLRAGPDEPGYDLTDFQSLPAGEKHQRRRSGPLTVGQVVGYALSIG